MTNLQVPFFRPDVTDAEVESVVSTLRSGWLTTGPRVREFEHEFALAVGAPYAIALNSCTAALHLAIEALGVRPGDAVLIPTMTFAATAEVIRYLGAYPVLCDCDLATGNLSLDDAARKIEQLRSGKLSPAIPSHAPIVGIVPVHVAGYMMDMDAVHNFAREHGLWVMEDAAHAFPAAWRKDPASDWQRCGQNTSAVTCFSFYANKTITTGEGGMAVTGNPELADRMRLMSLHGLSHDAWNRYSGGRAWDYRIVAPGYKYNMTDVAAALGAVQLQRAEEMRVRRESIAQRYTGAFQSLETVDVPATSADRIHSWHLYPIRLAIERIGLTRNQFIDALKDAGVGCSVHWRPLHLHPYYEETFAFDPGAFPNANHLWERSVSLPLFPAMRMEEIDYVISTVGALAKLKTHVHQS